MPDKSTITIIIIISELGTKELQIPQFGGGSRFPRLGLSPESSGGGVCANRRRLSFFLNRDSRIFRTNVPIKCFSLSMMFILIVLVCPRGEGEVAPSLPAV